MTTDHNREVEGEREGYVKFLRRLGEKGGAFWRISDMLRTDGGKDATIERLREELSAHEQWQEVGRGMIEHSRAELAACETELETLRSANAALDELRKLLPYIKFMAQQEGYWKILPPIDEANTAALATPNIEETPKGDGAP